MRNVFFKLILIGVLCLTSCTKHYTETKNGIETVIDSVNVSIQFYTPSIIRVFKTPINKQIEKASLTVVKSPEALNLDISSTEEQVTIASNKLSVQLSLKTGQIICKNTEGISLLREQDSAGVTFNPFTDAGKASYLVKQAFKLDPGEAIYGLGQIQNGSLQQRNKVITLKNDNHNITIPYFYSTKGYSVFWDNYASTTYNDSVEETTFESLGDCIDYYIMYGETGTGTVSKMRELTGQAPMFPLWTYGFWQSKERYKTQEEIVGVVKKYRDLKVPLDGIIQDWRYWGKDSLWNAMAWNKISHPDPKALADDVHKMNAHLMVVAWPGFGPLTNQYAEFKEKNMLIDFDTWPPKSGAKPYDVYNEDARNIYWDYLNKGVFSIGTDAWWLDSTEPDHINVKDEDFDQPTKLGSYRSVSNAFSLQHTKGIYENQRKTTEEKRVYILTRSSFAGQQRHAANSWSGDVMSSWKALGEQVPAALNFSICGIPYWNSDIGGFFAWDHGKAGGVKSPEFRELYVRWAQFASLTPMMRSHGTTVPREIYQFGERGNWAFDAIEKSIKLRYRLIPYLYATAWNVTNKSQSFMQALPLLYPNDDNVLNINDEYIFGSSILVAPVVTRMYTKGKDEHTAEDFSTLKSRKVYLPKGDDWVDFWTGEHLTGGSEVTRTTPIDLIPVYMKAGTILPWGPEVQYAEEKSWENLEIRIYPGANGEFTLYNDEGDNYNYEKGKYSTIHFSWNDKSKTLTIDALKGEYEGMLKSYNFNLVVVNANNGLGIDNSKQVTSVVYQGEKMEIKL